MYVLTVDQARPSNKLAKTKAKSKHQPPNRQVLERTLCYAGVPKKKDKSISLFFIGGF
jgi:hypothetical protein